MADLIENFANWDSLVQVYPLLLQGLWLSILLSAATLPLAVPLLTNRAIAIAKGTALGSAVSLPETLSTAQSITAIVANPSPLTLAAGFYLLLFVPLVVASRLLERRMLLRR